MNQLLTEKPNASLLKKWGKRPGLLGPYSIDSRVLYYSTYEGQFYDPTCDFFVEQDELDKLLIDKLMV